jgi:integrase
MQRTRTFERRSEATAFLATIETDMQRGDWVNPTLTKVRVEEWAKEWRGTIVHLERNTLAWYDGMLRVHVLPAFGNTPVGAIDQASVRRFVAALTASGKSSQMVKGAYQTLRNVLATAQGAGAIRVNACDGVKLPRPIKREMLFLSAEQVLDLSAAMAEPYGTLVTFAAYSGLRAGEIGGLRVGRLDLLRATVDVAEALKDTAGRLHFGADQEP